MEQLKNDIFHQFFISFIVLISMLVLLGGCIIALVASYENVEQEANEAFNQCATMCELYDGAEYFMSLYETENLICVCFDSEWNKIIIINSEEN